MDKDNEEFPILNKTKTRAEVKAEHEKQKCYRVETDKFGTKIKVFDISHNLEKEEEVLYINKVKISFDATYHFARVKIRCISLDDKGEIPIVDTDDEIQYHTLEGYCDIEWN